MTTAQQYQHSTQPELREQLRYVLLSLKYYRDTCPPSVVRALRAKKAYLLGAITPITH